ncbi:hypothetical protein [Hyphomicrobium sp.]|jgi:hypothetical protein|uniref:hypothetical protein n=1 Tax=Hyphomicrobium sp. TaxID=82 RepID=UPI0035670FF3
MQIISPEHVKPITIDASPRQLPDDVVFARLAGDNTPKQGSALVIYSAIEGKTPEEIQSKLSLTFIPDILCTVDISAPELTSGVLINNDQQAVRIFHAQKLLSFVHEQRLYPGVPVHLAAVHTLANGLHQVVSYKARTNELFARIYDRDQQPLRGEWVFSYQHVAGKSDRQIAQTFAFLKFSSPATCDVVLPEGAKVKGWAPPDSEDPYIYQLDLNDDIEFIDDRLLPR